MSTNKVEGITIEIYGDTVKFDNSIDGTKKALKLLAKESSGLAKQMRLDPTNVESMNKRLKSLQQQVKLNESQAQKYREELAKLGDEDIGSEKWKDLNGKLKNTENEILQLNGYIDDTQKAIKKVDEEKLNSLQQQIDKTAEKMKKAGSSVSDLGSTLTKKVTKPALMAASALAGLAIFKGFQRLVGIDNARAKLQGLGHDAKSVDKIMTSALESVKGTSYGMDAAATTAASAVAAGIEPGKELTRYLSLTADAAAIAGSSMSDMGSIVNKVTTSQAAYTGELNQLADRGIPIYQWLAKELDITAGEVKEFASDGKISSEVFLNAIENNIGGAAKKMGETSFTAGLANIWASISRIGANFLDAGGKGGGFFSKLKPLMSQLNEMLGNIEDKAAEIGVKLGDSFSSFIDKVIEIKEGFEKLSPSMQSFIAKILAIGVGVTVGMGPLLRVIGPLIKGFGGLSKVTGITAGKLSLIIGVAMLLVTALTELYNNNETFRNGVDGFVKEVLPVLIEGFSYLCELFTQQVIPVLQSLWQEFSQNILPVLMDFVNFLASVFMPIFNVLVDIVLNYLIPAFVGIISVIGSVLMPILETLWTIFNEYILPVLLSVWEFIAQQIIPLLGALANTVGKILSPVLNTLWSILSTIGGIIGEVATFIGTLISKFNEAIKAFKKTTAFKVFKEIIDGIATAVETLVGWLIDAATAVGDFFEGAGDFFGGVGEGIGDFVGWINPFDSGGFGDSSSSGSIELTTNINVTNNGSPISMSTIRQWGKEITDIVDEEMGRRR